jgi:hypothetical protein
VATRGVGPVGPGRRHLAAGGEVGEIAAVGADRRRRQPALDPQVGEVVVDDALERRRRHRLAQTAIGD